MKLSEMMFKGIKLSTPTRGSWVVPAGMQNNDFTTSPDCRACAVGTAWLGLGMDENKYTSSYALYKSIPELLETNVPCPNGGPNCGIVAHHPRDHGYLTGKKRAPKTLLDICSHLFEDHHWTREAVAMWVETREEAKEYLAKLLDNYGDPRYDVTVNRADEKGAITTDSTCPATSGSLRGESSEVHQGSL